MVKQAKHRGNENPMHMPEEDRLNRIRYRSWHRGCKETDIILGSFCDAHITSLSTAQLDVFEELLDEDDADIWAWLTFKKECPKDDYGFFIGKLRSFREYTPL